MYIKRVTNIKAKLQERSQFLFGPRSTGKTSLIENELADDLILSWDFLNTRLKNAVKADPGLLYEEVMATGKSEGLIVIDEIQKVPAVLDEVHRLIEKRGTDYRFLLTGSSARKLVSSGVNLLGGRAGKCYLFPLVYPEVKDMDFTLEHIFTSGLVPAAFLSSNPDQVLDDYIGTYLYDEIQSEGAVRNLPAFSDFLRIAAISNGEILQYTNIANDVGLSKTAIREWYRILSDTMLGYELEPYKKTRKRKPIETAKYYLFDVGVLRNLMRCPTPVETQTEYGNFFETFIIAQIRAYIHYIGKERDYPLCFWRSTSGFEVDLLIGEEIAIELKTAKRLIPRDFRGLKAFKEEDIAKRHIIICREERKRLVDETYMVYPWKLFLEELWDGRVL